MIKTYKVRLEPNKEQEQKIVAVSRNSTLGL